MCKFQKGDRVVLNTNYYEEEWGLPIGSEGVVSDNRDFGGIDVSFDDYKGGHNGDNGNIDDCSHLYVLPDHLEKTQKHKFKTGDRVVCTVENKWVPVGTVGIVMEDSSVPFVKWEDGEIWCLRDTSMELASTKKEKQKGNIVLFRQGNKVIAKLTYGKSVLRQAEATCNPEDTFDFLLGSQIALQRLVEQVQEEDTVIAVPKDYTLEDLFVY